MSGIIIFDPNEEDTMRAYFFGNMYLSSIQQGIQAAHVVAEMFVKYPEDVDAASNTLREWAICSKTMILLNGGYLDTINKLREFFSNKKNPYPWAPFYEGEDALGGVLTTVGIILPEKIYETASLIRSKVIDPVYLEEFGSYTKTDETTGQTTTWEYSAWEFKLIEQLNMFGLAS